MRVFVIGNSHVACMKLGWEKLQSEYPDFDLTFFAHRGKRIRDFAVCDDKLVPSNDHLKSAIKFTSGGLDCIVPKDADLIFLCGMGLKIVKQRPLTYSRQVLHQASRDQVQRSSSSVLLPLLRKITDQPILVGHDPMPAGSQADGDYCEYMKAVELMNEVAFFPQQAKLIPQPAETMLGGFVTKKEYSANSSRLSIGKQNDGELHPLEDIYHMNENFGKRYAEQLMSVIDSMELGTAK